MCVNSKIFTLVYITLHNKTTSEPLFCVNLSLLARLSLSYLYSIKKKEKKSVNKKHCGTRHCAALAGLCLMNKRGKFAKAFNYLETCHSALCVRVCVCLFVVLHVNYIMGRMSHSDCATVATIKFAIGINVQKAYYVYTHTYKYGVHTQTQIEIGTHISTDKPT